MAGRPASGTEPLNGLNCTDYGCTLAVVSATEQRRRNRINLRVDPSLEDRLRAAAELDGETLTGFLLAAGGERAAEILSREQRITVSDAGFRQFVAALDAPIQPMERLAGYAEKPGPIPGP